MRSDPSSPLRYLLLVWAIALPLFGGVLIWLALGTGSSNSSKSALTAWPTPFALAPTQTPRLVYRERVVTATAPSEATLTAMAATFSAQALTPLPTRTPTQTPTPPFGPVSDTAGGE